MKFRMDLKIFIFFAIFYFTNQLSLYLCTMLFCFIHELGHLFLGMCFGMKPESIQINPFGCYLKFKPYIKDNIKKISKLNILVAMAGPIVNLIIIFLIIFLHISFNGRDVVVYINLIILIFNLIPIYPLDGGRILKEFLNIFYDNINSYIIANKISNLFLIALTMCGSIAIYYFKNIAIVIILSYLWILVVKENRKFSIKKIISLNKKN